MLRPDDHGTGRHEVLDPAGRAVARVEITDRTDWLQADVTWSEPTLLPAALAAVLVADLAGLRVATTDPQLAGALVAAGGRVARCGTQLEFDVRRTPPPVAWLDRVLRDAVALADYRPVDAEIAAAWLAAYPSDHPDHDPAVVTVDAAIADLGSIQSGTVTGVFAADASVLAVDAGGVVLGGIMVTLMRPNPHWSGPWVPDVFVRPDVQGRGTGARLVRYAVAAVAAAGEPGLALTVTDGNPARRVYERVGFSPTVSFTSVAIPPQAGVGG